mgnify:CR=1 FL=1
MQQFQPVLVQRFEIALKLRGVLEIFHESRVFRHQFRASLVQGREQVVVAGRFIREPLENGRFVGGGVQFRAGLRSCGLCGLDGGFFRSGERRNLSNGLRGGDDLLESYDLPLPGE